MRPDMSDKKRLGILGGLGPAASALFYGMITDKTKASSDGEHIDVVLTSFASTPDRPAYLLGRSGESPLDKMIEARDILVSAGAEVIAVPCNTATVFFRELQKGTTVPILNIIDETVAAAKRAGAQKVGIMATEGTIGSGAYQDALKAAGLSYAVPDEDGIKTLMKLIYGDIKSGKPADMDAFYSVAESLREKGCDMMVLGCTELSLLPFPKEGFTDSTTALAESSIIACGYSLK